MTSVETTAIGDPIVTLSNELKSNEIWLEGQTLEIAKYRKLFKVYGTTWGGDGQTTFGVPDFRNRAIWGSGDGTFGYIEAGLPDITVSATTNNTGAHQHTRGNMNITGSYYLTGIFNNQTIATSFSGAFSGTGASSGGSHYLANYSTNGIRQKLSFSAQNNWTGNTSSNGNHTHTVTVNVTKNTSIYGNSTTVQPDALKVRVKCRAK